MTVSQVQTTISVPEDVWLAVKNEAAVRRTSANDIYVRAARQYLGLSEPEAADAA